ncbi:flavodoxin family protein [Bacteroides reticulotermitis]|nr:flavodoxin family protein [Bacteroides reticulotermitis]MBB4045898.1 multimeric flavodoxin WrbA [Bacteroides reticulotermitis]
MKTKLGLFVLMVAFFAVVCISCGKESSEKNTSSVNTEKVKSGSKSILILSSSPRRGGNSEILCNEFKKGAEEANHTVEMININDHDIQFFENKYYERSDNPEDADDAIRIIHKMAAADVIVLSSPVYFYSMTGQMKTLIDRVFKYEKDLKSKEFYYIITATDNNEEALEGTIQGFRGFIHCLYDSREIGIVRGFGARDSGSILKKPTAVQEAYEFGKNA